ncbi:MAG TPA: hypothetical protein PLV70_10200 [Flavobacteriales bacterium]|nr:hypothetical protein [Flavobacteriales bacterium]HRN36464.1 hypothetical protein [Flavobacteriales bacterium]HRO40814.1 hypothetical protein [Flavobacteriales bacterium]HRP82766.1 hypothetical protein [Flavobacteriales bacterium]HRQ85472.1 hypothetical protein [Flavobacteriales bacterium]
MNRIILAGTILLTGLATTSTQAQYRPAGGEKNLELMVAPLGGSPITMAGIKYRSFSSANKAMRVGLFLGFDNKTTVTQDEDSQSKALELKKKESSITIGIQPGIEKHLAGTERLSPYFGGYVDLNYTTKSKKDETDLVLTNGTHQLGYDKTTSGSLGIGVNAVAGFDYYIAKSLYLGTELGFGIATTMPMKSKSETVKLNDDGTGTATVSGDGKKDNVSKFQVGPNVVGQLRLGWLF